MSSEFSEERKVINTSRTFRGLEMRVEASSIPGATFYARFITNHAEMTLSNLGRDGELELDICIPGKHCDVNKVKAVIRELEVLTLQGETLMRVAEQMGIDGLFDNMAYDALTKRNTAFVGTDSPKK